MWHYIRVDTSNDDDRRRLVLENVVPDDLYNPYIYAAVQRAAHYEWSASAFHAKSGELDHNLLRRGCVSICSQ